MANRHRAVAKKKQLKFVKNTVLSPFSGSNFHFCLQSGPRGLTPPPPHLTVSPTVKYPFFDDFPYSQKNRLGQSSYYSTMATFRDGRTQTHTNLPANGSKCIFKINFRSLEVSFELWIGQKKTNANCQLKTLQNAVKFGSL